MSYTYTAIIVEPRCHKALSFVLENFTSNLSDEWSFIIFHGNQNIDFVIDIVDTKLKAHKNRIQLINLKVDNLSIDDYNRLFKYNKEFYAHIPTETFLVFQTDTIIFKKHRHLINEFLKYDYVGAPWGYHPRENLAVGNGGLSLRKKSKMLEIMESEGESDAPEDVYFSDPKHVSIYKPSKQEAMFFSVEQIFHPVSFGCHKPWMGSSQLRYVHDEANILFELNDV